MWKIVLMLLGVLVPGVFGGAQLAQVASSDGCPAHLLPAAGPLRLHVVVEKPEQRQALDAGALQGYLTDRFGRMVEVTGVEQADATGFRLMAAARPAGSEMLAFFADRAQFANVPTSQGMVNAVGFATPGSACAYVGFQPRGATWCDIGGQSVPLQPAYAYLAHEMGHLVGLVHQGQGMMGSGAFDLCGQDRFDAQQLAAIAAWGA
jgi:hypothetical protein